MAKTSYFVLVMDENKQHIGKKWGSIFKIFKQHLSLTWKKALLVKEKRVAPSPNSVFGKFDFFPVFQLSYPKNFDFSLHSIPLPPFFEGGGAGVYIRVFGPPAKIPRPGS